ncbi:MAG: hypothetical protein IPP10_16135 [Candidatus Competibacteraceae bacterium]|nr:hypothetical protein [Candidatus Competibacteraceae bacterium]
MGGVSKRNICKRTSRFISLSTAPRRRSRRWRLQAEHDDSRAWTGAAALHGKGNGPIDAFTDVLNRHFGLNVQVVDYHEHAIGAGADAMAVSYVEIRMDGEPNLRFGVGIDSNIVTASLNAGDQRGQPGATARFRRGRYRIGCGLIVTPGSWLLCLADPWHKNGVESLLAIPRHSNIGDYPGL